MISKQIEKRKDGRSSASDALRYGEGLAPDRETGELLDKSHRTRFGNFGLIDDGVYAGRELAEMAEMIDLAAIEMQANCEMNTKVSADKKMAHFMVSYGLEKPSEAVLRDTEDSMLASMKLDKNHFATFFHNDKATGTCIYSPAASSKILRTVLIHFGTTRLTATRFAAM